tara:strand:- start:926 stop:1306 length:381 start_codon:yes stop_codon:yes gene_type:complete
MLIMPFSMTLRIIPMHLSDGRSQLNTWIKSENDHYKLLSLKRSLRLFSDKDYLGCIGVIDDDHLIKSVSLFKKDNLNLNLKCVESCDLSSGSLLIKTIACTIPNLNLSSELDDRWKIAFMYYYTQN